MNYRLIGIWQCHFKTNIIQEILPNTFVLRERTSKESFIPLPPSIVTFRATVSIAEHRNRAFFSAGNPRNWLIPGLVAWQNPSIIHFAVHKINRRRVNAAISRNNNVTDEEDERRDILFRKCETSREIWNDNTVPPSPRPRGSEQAGGAHTHTHTLTRWYRTPPATLPSRANLRGYILKNRFDKSDYWLQNMDGTTS